MSNKTRPSGQVSIRGALYAKLTEGLPRDRNGEVRRGELQKRVDTLINAALDREGKKN